MYNYFINKTPPFLELIRLNKPIGFLLLFWPCAYGVGINSHDKIHYILLFKFLIGSIIMRPVGCIINDLWDMNFDSKVQRTENRPLAAQTLSIKESVILLAILLLFGFALILTFKVKTILLSFATIPFVILYPYMKRITYFPQLFLGLTFNFGVLIASMEINGYINLASLLVYIGCIFWTTAYDTIYGFMDIQDDKKIGIKSLPILLENRNPTLWIMAFYGIFAIITLGAIGYSGKLNDEIDFILSMIIITQIFWKTATLDVNNAENCLIRFKSNALLGLLVFFTTIT